MDSSLHDNLFFILFQPLFSRRSILRHTNPFYELCYGFSLFHPAAMGRRSTKPAREPTITWSSGCLAISRFVMKPITNEIMFKYAPKRFDFHNKLAAVNDKMPIIRAMGPKI